MRQFLACFSEVVHLIEGKADSMESEMTGQQGHVLTNANSLAKRSICCCEIWMAWKGVALTFPELEVPWPIYILPHRQPLLLWPSVAAPAVLATIATIIVTVMPTSLLTWYWGCSWVWAINVTLWKWIALITGNQMAVVEYPSQNAVRAHVSWEQLRVFMLLEALVTKKKKGGWTPAEWLSRQFDDFELHLQDSVLLIDICSCYERRSH